MRTLHGSIVQKYTPTIFDMPPFLAAGAVHMEQYEWTQGGADRYQPDVAVGSRATLHPEDCSGQASEDGPRLSHHDAKG